MDELFDKLKDSASKAKDGAEKIAKKVAKHTSNVINQTKLTFAVNETQGKIKDAYAEIGKIIYKKHLDGISTDSSCDDLLEQIDKLTEEVAMLNDKIAELKNSLKCPECGAFNAVDSEYCSKCGAHLKADDDAYDEYDEYNDATDVDEAFDEVFGEDFSDDTNDDMDEADDSIEYNMDDDVITIDPKKPDNTED